MKTNNKTYKTFLGYVYGEARQSEIKDINGNIKSFLSKNCRIILGIIISTGLLLLVPSGYDDSFLQLVTTIVSIFIGLFLLMFSLFFYVTIFLHNSDKLEFPLGIFNIFIMTYVLENSDYIVIPEN